MATLLCVVVAVSDGDTLRAKCNGQGEVMRVRLANIDAPEKQQPFGQRSRQSLSDMCFEKRAKIFYTKRDRYGRIVAHVVCDGVDANTEQVRRGMAWAYRQYLSDKSLVDVEAEARRARRGLWADRSPMAPWNFRKKERDRRNS